MGLMAPSDPDGDSLTITVKDLPAEGSIHNAKGVALTVGDVLTSDELTHLEYYAPAKLLDQSKNSEFKFNYTVSDGHGGSRRVGLK